MCFVAAALSLILANAQPDAYAMREMLDEGAGILLTAMLIAGVVFWALRRFQAVRVIRVMLVTILLLLAFLDLSTIWVSLFGPYVEIRRPIAGVIFLVIGIGLFFIKIPRITKHN